MSPHRRQTAQSPSQELDELVEACRERHATLKHAATVLERVTGSALLDQAKILLEAANAAIVRLSALRDQTSMPAVSLVHELLWAREALPVLEEENLRLLQEREELRAQLIEAAGRIRRLQAVANHHSRG